jgi:hypothetical protein
MANIGLAEEVFAVREEPRERAGKVRVAVHDASRLEWSVSLPLPADGEPVKYRLSVEVEVPQNAFVRHVPWDQLQAFTRLDGPAITGASDLVTIDALRRDAIAIANQLARASDGFARHCRLAASLFATAPHSELEEALVIWIDAASRIADDSRARLGRVPENEPAELARERALVDEYISVRVFEMLAGAEHALRNLASSKSPHAARVRPVIDAVEARLAQALAAELAYRAERGFGNADPTSPHALERYLERASRLKKHFQEVLFLEQETFQIAERAYHWVAGFVALLASTWAFVWNIVLTQQGVAAGTLSSGLVLIAIAAGIVYATKDRIKEIGRNWMTRRVHRMWGAQRISRYRAPQRRLAGRDVIMSARESFDQLSRRDTDALNPECGATRALTVLRYQHDGVVLPNKALVASGVRRVKHVFRYDLSPLFARLDDATKPVPVLDKTSQRVRFIDAPRCYRLPLHVVMEVNGERHAEGGMVVMHKRGIERIERGDESDPSLMDSGIEPS